MEKKIVIKKISSFIDLKLEKINKLENYVDLLLKWNKAKNLIGKNTERNIWTRHILDSSQVLKYIPEDKKIIVDFGSGAGLPGIILAILNEEKKVHLIESSSKKVNFLNEAKRIIKIDNIIIHAERIENIHSLKADVVTARAFAPLPKLFSYIYPFFGKDSLCILLKGCNYKDEIECAKKDWIFNYKYKETILKQKDISNTSSEGKAGVVLQISNLQKIKDNDAALKSCL